MTKFIFKDSAEKQESGETYLSGKEKTDDIIDSKDQHNERMEKLRKRHEAEMTKQVAV